MNVLVIASVHGLAGQAGGVRKAVEDLQRAAMAEDGCVDFRVGQELGEHGELTLLATWRDESSMRAHFRGAAYARYSDAVSPLLARPSDVAIHYIARTVHPLGDASTEPGRQG